MTGSADRAALAVGDIDSGRDRHLRVPFAIATVVTPDTLLQGVLKNVGHRVGRSTIARILKAAGVPPQPERPTSWQTFMRAHWGVIAGEDFFTTEVWTWRGLTTYYTMFVIDLATRRVQIVGSTPHPDGLFMRQVSRTLTATLDDAGVHVVRTPFRAPNANAYAERFVRSIKHECLNRMRRTEQSEQFFAEHRIVPFVAPNLVDSALGGNAQRTPRSSGGD